MRGDGPKNAKVDNEDVEIVAEAAHSTTWFTLARASLSLLSLPPTIFSNGPKSAASVVCMQFPPATAANAKVTGKRATSSLSDLSGNAQRFLRDEFGFAT